MNQSGYNDNFTKGIYSLVKSQYPHARTFFMSSLDETDSLDDYYPIYQSYLGLTDVLMKSRGGLNQCYQSSLTTYSDEPEIQINLACAEILMGHRRRSIQAIDKITYQYLTKENKLILGSFYELIGQRQRTQNGIYNRNKFVRKHVGWIFRKKENIGLNHVEIYIKEAVNNRYKNMIDDFICSSEIKKSLD